MLIKLRWAGLCAVILSVAIAISCTEQVTTSDLHTYHSEYTGSSGAKDIAVTMNANGTLDVEGLSDEASFPSTFSLGGSGRDMKIYPYVKGSENIHIKINPDVGYNIAAGLKFTDEVVIGIGQDGEVEVDRAGVVAEDTEGNVFESKRVQYNGETKILMCKR